MLEKTSVIFDIEATCEKEEINPEYDMETIEIGAIKVRNGIIIDEFQRFVKPQKVSHLTNYCIELTGIHYEDLEEADYFEEVILDFLNFIYGSTIYSSGNFDKNMFIKELEEKGNKYLHEFAKDVIQYSHKDLKKHYTKVMSKPRVGMYGMAKELGIEMSGAAHRALDDSKNLTKIFLKVEERREQELNKVFTDKRMDKLIIDLNNTYRYHWQIERVGETYIITSLNSPLTLKMNKVNFIDEWSKSLLDDYRVRRLKHISPTEYKIIEKFSN